MAEFGEICRVSVSAVSVSALCTLDDGWCVSVINLMYSAFFRTIVYLSVLSPQKPTASDRKDTSESQTAVHLSTAIGSLCPTS